MRHRWQATERKPTSRWRPGHWVRALTRCAQVFERDESRTTRISWRCQANKAIAGSALLGANHRVGLEMSQLSTSVPRTTQHGLLQQDSVRLLSRSMRGSARHPKEICRARPQGADRRVLLLHMPVLAPDFEVTHSGADEDEEVSSERPQPSVRAHLAGLRPGRSQRIAADQHVLE